jgi:hypothetical protein
LLHSSCCLSMNFQLCFLQKSPAQPIVQIVSLLSTREVTLRQSP